MKKVVVCLAVSLTALVVGACSAEMEEETGESSEELARLANAGECRLGNGLYCGGNGVNGAANVLYRCENGTVSYVAQCYGPCVRMPDGYHDKCNGYASNSSSSGGSGQSAPRIQLKKVNWSSCSNDGECASNRCGCNGSNLSRCLPNADYPKYCAGAGGKGGSKPNWAACSYDGECQTNWCGCNGGSEKRCLPTTQYPKYCR